jgi:hypothetical protein
VRWLRSIRRIGRAAVTGPGTRPPSFVRVRVPVRIRARTRTRTRTQTGEGKRKTEDGRRGSSTPEVRSMLATSRNYPARPMSGCAAKCSTR